MQVLRQRYDCRSPASDAVEDGDHLRHARHRHLASSGDCDERPEPHPGAYDPVVAGILHKKGKGYGHDHPGDADEVAIASVAR